MTKIPAMVSSSASLSCLRPAKATRLGGASQSSAERFCGASLRPAPGLGGASQREFRPEMKREQEMSSNQTSLLINLVSPSVCFPMFWNNSDSLSTPQLALARAPPSSSCKLNATGCNVTVGCDSSRFSPQIDQIFSAN